MPPYRRLNDAQLNGLDDDALITYVLAARAAGDVAAVEVALKVLAYGLEPLVINFVRVRLPKHGDTVIDQVAGQALCDAIEAIVRFQGSTLPEARAFVFRIVRRRIADFVRKKRIDAQPLEWVGEDGEVKSLDPGERGGYGAVELWSLIEQALAERNEVHRRVIEHFFFDDLSARDTASETNRHFGETGDDPMTEANVNQIASRFRKRVKELLDSDG